MATAFPLGQLVPTPKALKALTQAGQTPQEFLARHAAGDWGDVDAHDRAVNAEALRQGSRLMSVYHTRLGEALWVITEWDRSVTTLLLPEEY